MDDTEGEPTKLINFIDVAANHIRAAMSQSTGNRPRSKRKINHKKFLLKQVKRCKFDLKTIGRYNDNVNNNACDEIFSKMKSEVAIFDCELFKPSTNCSEMTYSLQMQQLPPNQSQPNHSAQPSDCPIVQQSTYNFNNIENPFYQDYSSTDSSPIIHGNNDYEFIQNQSCQFTQQYDQRNDLNNCQKNFNLSQINQSQFETWTPIYLNEN